MQTILRFVLLEDNTETIQSKNQQVSPAFQFPPAVMLCWHFPLNTGSCRMQHTLHSTTSAPGNKSWQKGRVRIETFSYYSFFRQEDFNFKFFRRHLNSGIIKSISNKLTDNWGKLKNVSYLHYSLAHLFLILELLPPQLRQHATIKFLLIIYIICYTRSVTNQFLWYDLLGFF